jgi:hypothetical protein
MGGQSHHSKENSWIINAGWHFFLGANCVEIGNGSFWDNVYVTTMFIQKVKAIVLFSLENASLISIYEIQKTAYPVNISQFFAAFTAPLLPGYEISVDDILVYNSTQGLDLRYGNFTNTTIATDEFVESMINDFINTFTSPAFQLRGFLVYALPRNSWGHRVD